MAINDFSIESINVGDVASFDRTWTEEDVITFSQLSGDTNPLHTDDVYASSTMFGRRVVHGMLVGSLCSKLVGMYLPGKRCLYLKQNLSFKNPVFIGDTITVSGTVTAKSVTTSLVTVAITISRGEDTVVLGEAVVKII